MKKTVYLHIGYPKTGTSAIQAAFYANRDRLREQGILYPESAVAFPEKGHHNLPRSLTHVPGIPHHLYRPESGGFDALLREMGASECKKAVVSSEGLNHVARTRPDVFHEVVDTYFRDFEVVIVIFLRRGDDYIESMFLQRLRNWYQDRIQTMTPPLESYWDEITRRPAGHLQTVFNALSLPYGLEVRWYKGDSVREMCDVVGYRNDLGGVNKQNPRLGLKQATLLYWLSASNKADKAKKKIRRDRQQFEKLWTFDQDVYQYKILPPQKAREIIGYLQPYYQDIARRAEVELSVEGYGEYEEARMELEMFSEAEIRAVENFIGFRLE